MNLHAQTFHHLPPSPHRLPALKWNVLAHKHGSSVFTITSILTGCRLEQTSRTHCLLVLPQTVLGKRRLIGKKVHEFVGRKSHKTQQQAQAPYLELVETPSHKVQIRSSRIDNGKDTVTGLSHTDHPQKKANDKGRPQLKKKVNRKPWRTCTLPALPVTGTMNGISSADLTQVAQRRPRNPWLRAEPSFTVDPQPVKSHITTSSIVISRPVNPVEFHTAMSRPALICCTPLESQVNRRWLELEHSAQCLLEQLQQDQFMQDQPELKELAEQLEEQLVDHQLLLKKTNLPQFHTTYPYNVIPGEVVVDGIPGMINDSSSAPITDVQSSVEKSRSDMMASVPNAHQQSLISSEPGTFCLSGCTVPPSGVVEAAPKVPVLHGVDLPAQVDAGPSLAPQVSMSTVVSHDPEIAQPKDEESPALVLSTSLSSARIPDCPSSTHSLQPTSAPISALDPTPYRVPSPLFNPVPSTVPEPTTLLAPFMVLLLQQGERTAQLMQAVVTENWELRSILVNELRDLKSSLKAATTPKYTRGGGEEKDEQMSSTENPDEADTDADHELDKQYSLRRVSKSKDKPAILKNPKMKKGAWDLQASVTTVEQLLKNNPSTTDEAMQSYLDGNNDHLTCTLKHFRVDFKHPWTRNTFNQHTRSLFIKSLITMYKAGKYSDLAIPPELLSDWIMGYVLDTHIEHRQKQWHALHDESKSLNEDAIAKLQKHKAMNTRRCTLWDNCVHVVVTLKLNRHKKLLSMLRPAHMSGDETNGPEKTHPPIFRIVEARWQSRAFKTFMQTLDTLYRETWANPIGQRAMSGNPPVFVFIAQTDTARTVLHPPGFGRTAMIQIGLRLSGLKLSTL
ncbi:hypothetical protein CERSUDRAFT_77602 [Gelatoporia subvermispora B]|uniref:Uncharacterized protein n=1 Tax=Ceriporiopsis subvermispora (strain B) TaxID=914234 RepID=M2PA06_CERS8|nr:hypothetical protein CERSUDRAFT_77602 [Gelatoporia subvermispora B]